jgi:secreted protein with Ig-like and vWFA domain
MDEIVGQDKLALAMDALSKMISQLQPDDTIAIVTFDNGAQVVHPRISVENIDKDVLKTHLQAIRPNG